MSVEENAAEEFDLEEMLECSLPASRIKKICRLDPDLAMISSDAVLFVTKATELFLKELAKASYTQAVLEKRKTIQTKDIDKAIASKHEFEFLEDTLDDWPEPESSRGVSQRSNTVEEVIPEEDIEEDDDSTNEDDSIVVESTMEEGDRDNREEELVPLSESVIDSSAGVDQYQEEATD